MNRRVVKTDDGSMTLYVPALGEHYHSIYGAITESEHIFIRSGLRQCNAESVRILEYGMGTGLNVLLTYQLACRTGQKIDYHAIEKYPVSSEEIKLLDMNRAMGVGDQYIISKIHDGNWEEPVPLSDDFVLYKEHADFRQAQPEGLFDLVYFDAFAPDVQPGLWSADLFVRIFSYLSPGAILLTYSAKGTVRRSLRAAGFEVEKLPGPPGKREISRALKPAAEGT